jgi:hypothetical protein
MLTSASHEPEQDASHFAWQSALGGVTSHRALHSPSHVDWQDERQRLVSAAPAHRASQLPEQSALHEAAQSNLAGSIMHSAEHVAPHVAVH